jgi:hypothetical protein
MTTIALVLLFAVATILSTVAIAHRRLQFRFLQKWKRSSLVGRLMLVLISLPRGEVRYA